MQRETLVHDDRLLDVVMQHDRLVATLASLLDRLGLERRVREVSNLPLVRDGVAFVDGVQQPSKRGKARARAA